MLVVHDAVGVRYSGNTLGPYQNFPDFITLGRHIHCLQFAVCYHESKLGYLRFFCSDLYPHFGRGTVLTSCGEGKRG